MSALARGGWRERLYALAALAISAGAIAFIAWGGLGRNLVYSWDSTQLRAAGAKAVGATVRLGGLVAEGSVHESADGLSFEVSDGRTRVPVRSHELPPQMFREGIAVVVEGTLASDGVFQGKRLMVSHGNEYRAASPQLARGGRP